MSAEAVDPTRLTIAPSSVTKSATAPVAATNASAMRTSRAERVKSAPSPSPSSAGAAAPPKLSSSDATLARVGKACSG